MNASGTARKGFFGQMFQFFKRPDQSALAFKAELDALTDQDKLDFWHMLNDAGFPCDPPVSSSGAIASPTAA